jgi:hypothetical protein
VRKHPFHFGLRLAGVDHRGAAILGIFGWIAVDAGTMHSAAWKLGQVLEVIVGSAENQLMLDCKRGDPKVVCWDGHRFAPKLKVELGVVTCGRFVREEHRNPWAVQKALEICRVGGLLIAGCKPRPKFTQHE